MKSGLGLREVNPNNPRLPAIKRRRGDASAPDATFEGLAHSVQVVLPVVAAPTRASNRLASKLSVLTGEAVHDSGGLRGKESERGGPSDEHAEGGAATAVKASVTGFSDIYTMDTTCLPETISVAKRPRYNTRRSSLISTTDTKAIRGPLKLDALSVVKAPPELQPPQPPQQSPPSPSSTSLTLPTLVTGKEGLLAKVRESLAARRPTQRGSANTTTTTTTTTKDPPHVSGNLPPYNMPAPPPTSSLTLPLQSKANLLPLPPHAMNAGDVTGKAAQWEAGTAAATDENTLKVGLGIEGCAQVDKKSQRRSARPSKIAQTRVLNQVPPIQNAPPVACPAPSPLPLSAPATSTATTTSATTAPSTATATSATSIAPSSSINTTADALLSPLAKHRKDAFPPTTNAQLWLERNPSEDLLEPFYPVSYDAAHAHIAVQFSRVPGLKRGIEKGIIKRVGPLPPSWIESNAVGWRCVLDGGQDALFLRPLPLTFRGILGLDPAEKAEEERHLFSAIEGISSSSPSKDKEKYSSFVKEAKALFENWYQVIPLPPLCLPHLTLDQVRLLAHAQASSLGPLHHIGIHENLRIHKYAWSCIYGGEENLTPPKFIPPNPYAFATVFVPSSLGATHNPSSNSLHNFVQRSPNGFVVATAPHSAAPHIVSAYRDLRLQSIRNPILATLSLTTLLAADVPSGSTSIPANAADSGFNSHLSNYEGTTVDWLSTQARSTDFEVPRNGLDAQTEVTVLMRAILLDWMWYVHGKYRLNNETMHLAASIVDRFLSRAPLARPHLQLLGVTALFVATKHEECWCPSVDNLVRITDGAYTVRQVLSMEITILRVLKFKVSAPTPYHFLVHALRLMGTDERSWLGKCSMALLDRSLQEADIWLGSKPLGWAKTGLEPANAALPKSFNIIAVQATCVSPESKALAALSGALLALAGPRCVHPSGNPSAQSSLGCVGISDEAFVRVPWRVPTSVAVALGCGTIHCILRAREVGYKMLSLFEKWDSVNYTVDAPAIFTSCAYPLHSPKSQVTSVMKKYSHYRQGFTAVLLAAANEQLNITEDVLFDTQGLDGLEMNLKPTEG